MTDAKPRTVSQMVQALCRAERMFTGWAPVLESWRRELLDAHDREQWHYLPGEMPEEGQEVLAVLHCVDENGREHTWFSTGGYERGRLYLDGGDEESIYAWRPLPEPPPVRGDE